MRTVIDVRVRDRPKHWRNAAGRSASANVTRDVECSIRRELALEALL
jgi:hypothetical protein